MNRFRTDDPKSNNTSNNSATILFNNNLVKTPLEHRLEAVRELDSTVDFCRGIIQLKVVITLAENEEGFTTKELARKLVLRYKAVADSLRKLEKKGLVAKVSKRGIEHYILTDKGWEYYEKLISVLSAGNNNFRRKQVVTSSRRFLIKDLAEDLTLYSYTADAVIALATARNYELPLSTIASLFKLSPSRAQSYLSIFSESGAPLKLYKKILRPSLTRKFYEFFGINKGPYKTYYKLSKDGLSLYYKLPHYIKFRNSIAAKIIKSIIGTAHPKLALRNLLFILSIGNAIALWGFLLHSAGSIIVLAWLLFQLFILLLVYLAY